MDKDFENFLKTMGDLKVDVGDLLTESAVEGVSKQIDPIIEIGEALIKKYSPKIGEHVKQLNDFITSLDLEAYKAYTDAGIELREAVHLIISRRNYFGNVLKEVAKTTEVKK